MKRLQQKKTAVQKDDESVIKIWIRLPYLSNKGEEVITTAQLHSANPARRLC